MVSSSLRLAALLPSLYARFCPSGRNGGPTRLFAHVQFSYSAVVTYGEREVVQMSERGATLRFTDDFSPPSYHAGVMGEAITAAGSANTVRGTAISDTESVYEITIA
jgi:uncharacterized protein (TIGR02265 family)